MSLPQGSDPLFRNNSANGLWDPLVITSVTSRDILNLKLLKKQRANELLCSLRENISFFVLIMVMFFHPVYGENMKELIKAYKQVYMVLV